MPDPQTQDPRFDPTTGEWHADPLWRRYQPGGMPASQTPPEAITGLENALPTPPAAPQPNIAPGFTPRLSVDQASQVNIPAPVNPPTIDDYIKAHSSFGTMGSPG